VTAGLALIGEPLRRAGIFDMYQTCPGYRKFGDAMLHFVQPWGQDLSNTGDHGDDFGNRELILGRLAAETVDATLIWLLRTLSYNHGRLHPENNQPEFYREASLGDDEQVPASMYSLFVLDMLDKGVHPGLAEKPTSFHGPQRGIVSFRSGWDADATFVVFDGSQRSPAGQGHAHASCGHFSLSALGEYFSIDTGRYNNEQSCHSVVLVNGKSGRGTEGDWTAVKHHGRLIEYAPAELMDIAGVDSSHQHDCYWAWRWLGLVKGAGAPAYTWIVDDLNACDDWAEYWWQMQCSPENKITLHDDSATITGWRHGKHLDVHFALPAAEEYPEPHEISLAQDLAICSSTKYVDPERIPSRVARYPRPAAMVH